MRKSIKHFDCNGNQPTGAVPVPATAMTECSLSTAIAPMALEELETMNVTSINQEDVIEAWEADRYGHPKKVRLTRLSILANHDWVMTPQADRFGHIKEPNFTVKVTGTTDWTGSPREGR